MIESAALPIALRWKRKWMFDQMTKIEKVAAIVSKRLDGKLIPVSIGIEQRKGATVVMITMFDKGHTAKVAIVLDKKATIDAAFQENIRLASDKAYQVLCSAIERKITESEAAAKASN